MNGIRLIGVKEILVRQHPGPRETAPLRYTYLAAEQIERIAEYGEDMAQVYMTGGNNLIVAAQANSLAFLLAEPNTERHTARIESPDLPPEKAA